MILGAVIHELSFLVYLSFRNIYKPLKTNRYVSMEKEMYIIYLSLASVLYRYNFDNRNWFRFHLHIR